MNDNVVQIRETPIPVWPEGQDFAQNCHERIVQTQFLDGELYHESLRAKLLEMESDPSRSRKYYKGACGTKVHHVEQWGFPEADLLNARALEFYRRVLNSPTAVADLTWASIYRKGDYCMPHSHVRSTASVLYFLDAGDEDPDDTLGGAFCFTDPRLEVCCPEQDDCMTVCFSPGMTPGTMMIFPSQTVHCVNPYMGERPRITLSWNINAQPEPGEALPKEMRAGANSVAP